jgi:hypothetical protein
LSVLPPFPEFLTQITKQADVSLCAIQDFSTLVVPHLEPIQQLIIYNNRSNQLTDLATRMLESITLVLKAEAGTEVTEDRLFNMGLQIEAGKEIVTWLIRIVFTPTSTSINAGDLSESENEELEQFISAVSSISTDCAVLY